MAMDIYKHTATTQETHAGDVITVVILHGSNDRDGNQRAYISAADFEAVLGTEPAKVNKWGYVPVTYAGGLDNALLRLGLQATR